MLNKLQLKKSNAWFSGNFDIKLSTNGWYIFDCPYCGRNREKNKAAVKYSWQRVKCWECDASESIVDFIGSVEGLKYHAVLELLAGYKELSIHTLNIKTVSNPDALKFPSGYKPINSGNTLFAKRARTYLEGRKIDLFFAESLHIGYNDNPDSKYFGCIIIPFFSNGTLIYFIARDYINPFPYLRYKNPETEKVGVGKGEVLFNEDALYFYNSVAIVEGAIDAMTVGKFGVSTQGWKLSDIQIGKILEAPVKSLYFIPDLGVDNKGVTFLDYAYKTALRFVDYKKIYIVDLSPFEHIGKDVNQIGIENLKILLRGIKPLSKSDLLLKLMK